MLRNEIFFQILLPGKDWRQTELNEILIIIFSFDLYTATTTYTGYCNMYDMVQIEKAVDATEGGVLTDWFEGRMIP